MDIKIINSNLISGIPAVTFGLFDGETKVFEKSYKIDAVLTKPIEAVLPQVKEDFAKVEASYTKIKSLKSEEGKVVDLSKVKAESEK